MLFAKVENKGKFVKKALVHVARDSYSIVYVDLKTGEKYKKFDVCDAKIGEMYVNLDKGMKSVSEIIEYRRNNISKRKILKKYNKLMEVE